MDESVDLGRWNVVPFLLLSCEDFIEHDVLVQKVSQMSVE